MERAFLCNIVEDAGSGLEQFQTPAIRRGGSEGCAQRFELLVESIQLAPCRAGKGDAALEGGEDISLSCCEGVVQVHL